MRHDQRPPEIVEMKRGEPLVGASNAHHYAASVPVEPRRRRFHAAHRAVSSVGIGSARVRANSLVPVVGCHVDFA